MTTLRKNVSDPLRRQGFIRNGQAPIRRVDDDFSPCVDAGSLGPRTDTAPAVAIRSDAVERAPRSSLGPEDLPGLERSAAMSRTCCAGSIAGGTRVLRFRKPSSGVIRLEHTAVPGGARVRALFLAAPTGTTPPKSAPDSESLGAAWVSADDLVGYPLRGAEVGDVIRYVALGGAVYPLTVLQAEGSPHDAATRESPQG